MRKVLIAILLILCGCSSTSSEHIKEANHYSDGAVAEVFDITKIDMKDVESSAIAYIGYSKERLIIVFNSSLDRCYVYENVPYDVYRDLLNAESIGGYYNKYIKGTYGDALRIDDIEVVNGHIKYK